MIYLGLTVPEKTEAIQTYCRRHAIKKIFLLSPEKFSFTCGLEAEETIEWADIIRYHFFYRLLQEIDAASLVVINECLRTRNRYDLTYNCIRHFLNQAGHQLVFQWLPFIEEIDDFMILFDFDTRSRWKRMPFDKALLAESELETTRRRIEIRKRPVKVDTKLRGAYQAEKNRLIAGIGLKDPHTIPRNLYLMSGKARLQAARSGPQLGLFSPNVSEGWLVGRNNRFRLERFQTFKENSYPHAPYLVFEMPHNFIDFSDFLALAQQDGLEVLVADLKVDHWYFERYHQWTGRLADVYANLS